MTEKKAAAFPTKDEILEFIRENPGKCSKREIARAFAIKNDARIKLKKLIRLMTDSGEITKGHKAKLHITDDLPPVTVVEITGTDNFGDLTARPTNWDPAEHDGAAIPAITISANDKKANLAIGSRALVRLTPKRGKHDAGYMAKIIRKLESQSTVIMGVFEQYDENIAYVKPTDKKDRDDYLIAKSDWNDARTGDLVLIEVISARKGRDRTKSKPAKIRETLGALTEPRSISLIAIHTHGIPNQFPAAALEQAEKSEDPVLSDGLTDLRDIPLITIDPATARDHDDAIWAELDSDPKNKGGVHVIIAIADVARYVTPGSAIDSEAWTRGNSVYFPNRVVPMIPERLSNGLCSLKEGEDRYTMAVHIWFDARGKKLRHQFVRGLMKSHGGVSYEEFQAAHDAHLAGDLTGVTERALGLLDTVIEPLYAAYEILKKGRDYREPLELSVPERQIKINDEGKVTSIDLKASITAHRLVEEFMIQANVAAAEQLESKSAPCMYRVHEEPSFDKLENLREFLDSLGHNFAKGQVIRPKIFNNFLNKVKGTEQEEVINTIILRTQMKAKYTSEKLGHFGLSLSSYAHFTSPIRRYADTIVHRALITSLGFGEDGLSAKDIEKFEDTAEHISETERTAMIAERESNDRYVAAFMADQVGKKFEGKIGGVSRAGLFITLKESGGDGFIPVSSMAGDYFHHDSDLHMLKGERTGISFQLGDKVTVRLKEATPITGGLILELIDEELAAHADKHPKRGGRGAFRRNSSRKGGARKGGSDQKFNRTKKAKDTNSKRR